MTTSREQDREMKAWLDNYSIADMDPTAHNALLDRIVANASACPRSMPKTFSLRSWMTQGLANAAALAALAVFGFWIGEGSSGPRTATTVSEATVLSSDAAYFDKIVLGPNSWKEVSL